MKEDFHISVELMHELFQQMEEEGIEMAPALHGALSAILFKVIRMSPDTETAFGLISSCMASATAQSLLGSGKNITKKLH